MTQKKRKLLIIIAAILLVAGGVTAAIAYFDSTHLRIHGKIETAEKYGWDYVIEEETPYLAPYHTFLIIGIAVAVIGLAGLITLLCVKPKTEIRA